MTTDPTKWTIDRSTDSPILTYEQCSVIQDEQAEYVLELIRRASPSVREIGEPVVRALEWSDGEAKTGFGSAYAVHRRADGMCEAVGCGSFAGGPHPDMAEAKAAAQADFERRVLACLSPTPQAPATPPAPVVVEALREELRKVAYVPGDHPVVPTKHDAFVKAVQRIVDLASLSQPAKGEREGGERSQGHYDRDGYCDNPARGY